VGHASAGGGALRFLLYSHDGVGLGHVRRNLTIACALTHAVPQTSILIATSAQHADDLGELPDGVDVLRIPAIRKLDNGRYASRRLPLRDSELYGLRSRLLAAAVESFRPDVVLVDKHPIGVKGELRSALAIHRSRAGKTVLGLRDILDHPAVVRKEWAAHNVNSLIQEHCDRVLIYGKRRVFDPVRAYGFPSSVARRTTFCGYVSSSGAARPDGSGPVSAKAPSRPNVLATVGGGEDGASIVAAFIEAATQAPW
jgi:predicted glycosyltransferase